MMWVVHNLKEVGFIPLQNRLHVNDKHVTDENYQLPNFWKSMMEETLGWFQEGEFSEYWVTSKQRS